MVSLKEQLNAVDRCINDFADWQGDGSIEARTLAAMQEIRDDLLARRAGIPGRTLHELQRLISDAAATKTALGMDTTALVAIGHEVITRWPIIRQSLERFNRETQPHNHKGPR